MSAETIANTLTIGHVWKEYGPIDYGDIIRWQVAAKGKRVAILVNLATLKQMVVTHESLSTFTFQCARDKANDFRIPASMIRL
jgi:hypothetical protein